MNVLLIEDCEIATGLVEEILKSDPIGYEYVDLTVVRTRAEAERALEERWDFDVAFVDYILPDGTSEGLADKIRQTQSSVSHIIASSGCPYVRREHMSKERFDKFQITHVIGEINAGLR